MDKQIHLVNKEDAERLDIEYWKSKSAEEKLSTIQQLREQYIRLFNKQKEYNEARKGLRRFYKVVKRT